MDVWSLVFAGVAGILSPLSPCVLPLLPVVLGAAASEHKMGPVVLATGLALSFAGIGFFVSTVGFALGLDGEIFRQVAAILMLAVGTILVVPQLQARVAVAAGPLGSWTEQRFGNFSRTGLFGQFGVGVLLGAVWGPCIGPTLGAASIMAARGENLAQAGLTMLAFGVGAALPLVVLGTLSREALMRWRGSLLTAGKGGKLALGFVLIAAGVVLLTHMDRKFEAHAVKLLPAWVLEAVTKY
jgi:cytochrome c biogenesis protein CcdA